MRIRTQLILAAFVLAVIPLAAIVTYSYHSSRRALESAYRREADGMNRQMDRRLASIRADLDQRLSVVSSLPLPSEGNPAMGGNIVTVMGDAASLVDSLEFQPIRVADLQPQVETREARPEVAEVAERTEPTERTEPAERTELHEAPEPAEMPAMASIAPPAPLAPRPPGPLVIDLPPRVNVPRFVMSEEHKELIDEMSRVGQAMSNQQLDPAQRADLRREMQALQEELRRVVEASRRQFQAEMRQTLVAQQDQQAAINRARRAGDGQHRRGGAPPAASVSPVAAPEATPKASPAPKVAAMPSVAAVPASGQKREVSQSEIRQPQVSVRKVTKKDVEQGVATAKRTSLIFGREFEAPVRKEGEVVGQLTARISNEQVIRRILGSATEDSTEVPFALDREGTIYTRNPDERALLERLGVPQRLRKGESLRDIEGWIVTSSTDSQSGLRIGVARPVGENLDELRNTAARNFSLGMGLIAFALIGIVPLTNHLTRDVKVVTEGAERIAHGDLMTRLPVKSKNELGQLARAFNRMAEDLSHQQQRLLEQERARKEQELQQRLMSVEYERKSVELEEARRFQLSMLPKELPQHERYDVAVYTRTATEVGGDYYDFHLAGDVLSVTIGDATGHGAKAGTMVTIVKTLFSGYDGATGPAAFLHNAAEKIKRMDLGRMAMALSLGRLDPRSLTLSSAGMPPVLVHRAATSAVEEVALNATPLGTLGSAYDELTVTLAAGDTVLFLTDGFPELMNDAGQQLGYGAALEAFAEAARGASAAAVIEGLAAFAARWHGDAAPNDDVTFVVVRMA